MAEGIAEAFQALGARMDTLTLGQDERAITYARDVQDYDQENPALRDTLESLQERMETLTQGAEVTERQQGEEMGY
jgi:hypothetical protein